MTYKKIIAIIFCCVLMSLTIGSSQAKSPPPQVNIGETQSNREQRRAELEAGNWTVIYGSIINEGDYLELAEALQKVIAETSPQPLYDLFEAELDKNVDIILQEFPQLSERALYNLLAQAFHSRGQNVRIPGIEIEADIVPYDRWTPVTYPKFSKCEQEIKFDVCDKWGLGFSCRVETKIDFVPCHSEGKYNVPVLREFQPYIRYRLIFDEIEDLPSPEEKLVELTQELQSQSVMLIPDWAESDNRYDLRKSIEGDGWHVVWGVNVDEFEYVKMTEATAASIVTYNPGPLLAYFEEYLARTLEKIEEEAPEIGEEALKELIIRAIESEGKVMTRGRLEMDFDIATYNRHVNFSYCEPRTKKVTWEFGPVKTDGFKFEPCVPTKREVKMPNHHQPYFRFRWKGDGAPKPSGTPQVTNGVYFSNDDARSTASSDELIITQVYSKPDNQGTYSVFVEYIDPEGAMIQGKAGMFVEGDSGDVPWKPRLYGNSSRGRAEVVQVSAFLAGQQSSTYIINANGTTSNTIEFTIGDETPTVVEGFSSPNSDGVPPFIDVASDGFYIANENSNPIWVTVGYIDGRGDFFTEGWTRIESGDVQQATSFVADVYYLHATDNKSIWDGQHAGWVDYNDGDFLIREREVGLDSRQGRNLGYTWVDFLEVDAQGSDEALYTIRPQNNERIPTRSGSITYDPDVATSPARTAEGDIVPATLDDDISTQGLYFTNNTDAALNVAVQYYDADLTDFVTEGWLNISPGETAQALSGPLENLEYAYHVQDRSNVWPGDGTHFSWVDSGSDFTIYESEVDDDRLKAQGFTLVPFYTVTNQEDSHSMTIPLSAPQTLEWVAIPESEFTMGSSKADIDATLTECNATEGNCERAWFSGETPQQSVSVDAFEITKFEITNAQYNLCVTSGECIPASRNIPESNIDFDESFLAPDSPIVGVRAVDAALYCEWAGGRLPTEEEWELAARGTDGRRYPWGDAFEPYRANLSGETTTAVGTFSEGASPFGVMDMAGNVFEWTSSQRNSKLVLRGGGWNSYYFRGRATDRGTFLIPGFANYDIGFRCVREPQMPLTSTPACEVDGIFANLWTAYDTRLGCPETGWRAAQSFPGGSFGEMPFDNGHMFWFAFDEPEIIVAYDTGGPGWTGRGTWAAYPDTWEEGDPEFSCTRQREYPEHPKWGFGRVWCDYPEVNEGLGWGRDEARDVDRESPGSDVYRLQKFENGFIFRDSDGWTNSLAYIFFNDGTFVRQDY